MLSLAEVSPSSEPPGTLKASQGSCGFCSRDVVLSLGPSGALSMGQGPSEAQLRDMPTDRSFSSQWPRSPQPPQQERIGDLGYPEASSHSPQDSSLEVETVTSSWGMSHGQPLLLTITIPHASCRPWQSDGLTGRLHRLPQPSHIPSSDLFSPGNLSSLTKGSICIQHLAGRTIPALLELWDLV